MPTSAAGSSERAKAPTLAARAAAPHRRLRGGRGSPAANGGFTLLELLIVVAIIAVATAGVSFALRDSRATQLEREAQRLAALLESARAQSRSSGAPIRWYPTADGFRFDGAAPQTLPDHWLNETTQASGSPVLVLGPEPIIGRQEVVLASSALPGRSLRVATDGLRPFAVSQEPAP